MLVTFFGSIVFPYIFGKSCYGTGTIRFLVAIGKSYLTAAALVAFTAFVFFNDTAGSQQRFGASVIYAIFFPLPAMLIGWVMGRRSAKSKANPK